METTLRPMASHFVHWKHSRSRTRFTLFSIAHNRNLIPIVFSVSILFTVSNVQWTHYISGSIECAIGHNGSHWKYSNIHPAKLEFVQTSVPAHFKISSENRYLPSCKSCGISSFEKLTLHFEHFKLSSWTKHWSVF